ncbi:hypothetical protein HJG60_012253 [Phyllostomus discolor]|uniref:Uncharacterized protein n=1 Tax=Phyllostomus discolor TaxID=89673 RepID=A0A834DRL9_9CHIR|nr:hypothetical protein HJG60_012253 [Phyllostomus discolor]
MAAAEDVEEVLLESSSSLTVADRVAVETPAAVAHPAVAQVWLFAALAEAPASRPCTRDIEASLSAAAELVAAGTLVAVPATVPVVTLVAVETPVAVDPAVAGALRPTALATSPPSRPLRPHVHTSRAIECSTWEVVTAASPLLAVAASPVVQVGGGLTAAVALATTVVATLGSTPGVARTSRSATRSKRSRCLSGHANKASWMPPR